MRIDVCPIYHRNANGLVPEIRITNVTNIILGVRRAVVLLPEDPVDAAINLALMLLVKVIYPVGKVLRFNPPYRCFVSSETIPPSPLFIHVLDRALRPL